MLIGYSVTDGSNTEAVFRQHGSGRQERRLWKALDADERVVIDGQLWLTRGSRTEIRTTAVAGTRAEQLS